MQPPSTLKTNSFLTSCLIALLSSTLLQAQDPPVQNMTTGKFKIHNLDAQASFRTHPGALPNAEYIEVSLVISVLDRPINVKTGVGAPLIYYDEIKVSVLDGNGQELEIRRKNPLLDFFMQSGNSRSTTNSGRFIVAFKADNRPKSLKVLFKGTETHTAVK
jgi:hypothetical protein